MVRKNAIKARENKNAFPQSLNYTGKLTEGEERAWVKNRQGTDYFLRLSCAKNHVPCAYQPQQPVDQMH